MIIKTNGLTLMNDAYTEHVVKGEIYNVLIKKKRKRYWIVSFTVMFERNCVVQQ